jgi:hypothetical protein
MSAASSAPTIASSAEALRIDEHVRPAERASRLTGWSRETSSRSRDVASADCGRRTTRAWRATNACMRRRDQNDA